MNRSAHQQQNGDDRKVGDAAEVLRSLCVGPPHTQKHQHRRSGDQRVNGHFDRRQEHSDCDEKGDVQKVMFRRKKILFERTEKTAEVNGIVVEHRKSAQQKRHCHRQQNGVRRFTEFSEAKEEHCRVGEADHSQHAPFHEQFIGERVVAPQFHEIAILSFELFEAVPPFVGIVTETSDHCRHEGYQHQGHSDVVIVPKVLSAERKLQSERRLQSLSPCVREEEVIVAEREPQRSHHLEGDEEEGGVVPEEHHPVHLHHEDGFQSS